MQQNQSVANPLQQLAAAELDHGDEEFVKFRSAVSTFASGARERSAEIDAARTVPKDLIEDMRSIGIFRMSIPKSLGGMELDFPRSLEILQILARADASLGWVVMIGAHIPLTASALPPESYEAIFADSPGVIGAGAAIPPGVAEIVDGGYRVSGRWAFLSGSPHADYMYGVCCRTRDGKKVPGLPQILCYAPAKEWTLEDTWYTLGLRGTGSNDARLNDVFIPEEMTFEVPPRTNVPGPLYAMPRPYYTLTFAAVVVGIAKGAIDEIVDHANSGKRLSRGRAALRDSPVFVHELGRASAAVEAAEAYLSSIANASWDGVLADKASATEEVRIAQAAVWLATTAASAIDACYALAGSSVVYEGSPLQKRLRDIRTAMQHAAASTNFYGLWGRVVLGMDPEDGEYALTPYTDC